MKKIYAFLFTLVLIAATVFDATALTFYVTVDNPDNVKFEMSWVEQTLVAGKKNTMNSASGYCPISISGKNGASIVSVTKNKSQIAAGNVTFYSDIAEGDEFVITSLGPEPAKSFTINVDGNPADVYLSKTVNYVPEQIVLSQASTNVSFDNNTKDFTIRHTDYTKTIYEVKVGDEVLTPAANGNYSYTANDGDVVTVTVETPPATRYPVHFEIGDEAEGFIKTVEVDGVEAQNWAGPNFDVEAGASMTITCDTENYKVGAFKINGGTASLSNGQHTFTVTSETTVSVDARHYYEWNVTLNVDEPTLIDVWLGSSVNGEKLDITETNAIKVDERSPVITICAKYSADINSVTCNDSPVEPNGSEYTVNIGGDATINVSASLIERNLKAIVYVNDKNYADAVTLTRTGAAMTDVLELESGYTTVNFYEKDNPYTLSITPGPVDYYVVKQNYEVVEQPELSSGGTYNYSLTLEDGDLIQLYMGHVAVDYDVTIEQKGAVEGLKVVRDFLFEVEDFTESVTLPEGTAVTITTEAPVEISVNGELAGKEITEHTFYVQYATTVSIVGNTSSVADIAADNGSDVQWFTLQGCRLTAAPTTPGLYIRSRAGRASKVIVK